MGCRAISDLFTDEELGLAAEMDVTPQMLTSAVRHGTQEVWYVAHDELEPLFRGLLGVTPFDQALGSTFYRLLCCLKTLCELELSTQFQAISATTRTCLELCMDVHLLTGGKAIDRAAQKVFV